MKNSIKRILSALLALICLVSLTSCAGKKNAGTPSGNSSDLALPLKEANVPSAPYGDKKDSEVYRAGIYYASGDNSVTVPSTRVLWLNSESAVERRLAEELMKVPGGDAVSVVPRGSRIASVEAAGKIVTVNVLPASSMSDLEIKTLTEAMSKTLFGLDGVEGVNLLLNGRAASVFGLPVGLVGKSTDISALYDESVHFAESESASVMRRAVGYFPSTDESCVIPAETTLALNPADPAEAILRALGTAPGAEAVLAGVPACESMFEKKSHYEFTPTGDRILYVHLTSSAYTALVDSGLDRNIYLASIVLTLTSFLNDTDGVAITIGGKTITEVPLSNGTTLTFPDGIMKRDDFTHYIGKNITLYFADENGMLRPETKALPLNSANSPRARICALMAGPKDASLNAVFPVGAKPSDILGVQLSGSVASVNFSSNVYRLAQSFTQAEEELFVYSLVNTLSELRGISGVRLYFEGETGSVLTHKVYMEGVLLKNPGRIQLTDTSASN